MPVAGAGVYAGALQALAPPFRHYLHHVCTHLEFGLCKSKVEVERLRTPCDEPSDQCCLVLPYCGKQLKWEVMFDRSVPWFAPDFRFDDSTFLADADEDFMEKGVPSLLNWEQTNPNALSKVISELMALYRIHQTKLLSEDENSRAYFEYTALLGDAITSEEDVEVWVGHGNAVQFLIRLNIDAARLPEIFNEGELNPGGDCALLMVRFPNCTAAELILSPLVTRAVGNIILPPYRSLQAIAETLLVTEYYFVCSMHQSGVLMDYVPMVTDLLNKKIKSVLVNEKLKRELLSQLVVKYEGAVLEHDSKSAAFLFHLNDFHWILQIEIGENFPERAPTLTLRSVYHSSKGKPRTKVLSACPYNNLEEYIEQQVEIFKSECTGGPTSNQTVIS